jgi:hypothetical protein
MDVTFHHIHRFHHHDTAYADIKSASTFLNSERVPHEPQSNNEDLVPASTTNSARHDSGLLRALRNPTPADIKSPTVERILTLSLCTVRVRIFEVGEY